MRIAKYIGIAVVLLLLIAIAIPFFIDANQFRPRLEAALSESLGRRVKMGKLTVALWSGGVRAEELSIADDPAYSREPFLEAKSLQLKVELVPQGTLIERIRAGGYGLGGVLTPTGVGTIVEEGKQRIEVNGKPYLVETALRADFALVHAFLADYLGNLSYALTARNFNPVIAMAGDTVITDADHIVPVGVISPDHVVTPAPIVDYLIAN